MRPTGSFGGFLMAVSAGAALIAGGLATASASASTTAGTSAGAPGPAQAASHRIPDFGNTGGHASVPRAGAAVNTSQPDHVIGTGTPASCTSAAVVKAVASGGTITFSCGPNPVTITMTTTAKVRNTSHQVVLDGGGLVTLSGGGKRQILYQNTCDPKQKLTSPDCYNQPYPQLTLQNITLKNGNSQVRQSPGGQFGGGGGGAVFALGGQLKVVNSRFLNNRCYQSGPDLGGAAIRALAQYRNRPVYITRDTFSGGRCSNGGALSSIGVSWVVTNSVLTTTRPSASARTRRRPVPRAAAAAAPFTPMGTSTSSRSWAR